MHKATHVEFNLHVFTSCLSVIFHNFYLCNQKRFIKLLSLYRYASVPVHFSQQSQLHTKTDTNTPTHTNQTQTNRFKFNPLLRAHSATVLKMSDPLMCTSEYKTPLCNFSTIYTSAAWKQAYFHGQWDNCFKHKSPYNEHHSQALYG